jgi:hypothetical protein
LGRTDLVAIITSGNATLEPGASRACLDEPKALGAGRAGQCPGRPVPLGTLQLRKIVLRQPIPSERDRTSDDWGTIACFALVDRVDLRSVGFDPTGASKQLRRPLPERRPPLAYSPKKPSGKFFAKRSRQEAARQPRPGSGCYWIGRVGRVCGPLRRISFLIARHSTDQLVAELLGTASH